MSGFEEAMSEMAIVAYENLGLGNSQSRANFSFTEQRIYWSLWEMARAYNMNNYSDECYMPKEDVEEAIFAAMAEAKRKVKAKRNGKTEER